MKQFAVKIISEPLHYLYLLLFLFLPWSYEHSFGKFALVLPTEPILILISFFLAKEIYQKRIFSSAKNLISQRNTLLLISIVWFLWQIISIFFSSMPLVSGKYVLIETLHWMVFGVGIFIFPRLFWSNLPWFIGSLSGLVLFSLFRHSTYSFIPEQSNLAALPFFSDHTMYSATLVMSLSLLPILTKNVFFLSNKWLLTSIGSLNIVGIYFSYCRAAWLTLLLLGASAFVFFLYKKNKKVLLGCILGALGILFFTKKDLPEKTISDGNANGNVAQLASIANLTTDASNLERLNRYSCAWRMSLDRPLMGFGVGTFQFQYFNYQKPAEMTRISVTAPVSKNNGFGNGRGGGAHSEYFQALAELGFTGLLIWLFLGVGIFFTAINRCRKSEFLVYCCILASLSSFLLHGLVNNFLHDARIALLFWGQIAILCTHQRKN
jgi:putative inorganic carbon (hco3(-)) transporter